MVVVNIQGKENIYAPCQRMATAIAEIIRQKEMCFPSDLNGSFSDDELNKYWDMAYALAHVDLMVD